MVRWIATEMVVVEMTSGNPSYRVYGRRDFFLSEKSSIIYDKPFKTYEELVNLMIERHIIISDTDFAIHALQNFSYYDLVNGYKNTFLQVPGTDDFIPGTKFEELYTLHLLDASLNNVIFKYILFLEKALKSRLSYLVAQKYGVFTDYNDFSCKNEDDYLYVKHYSNSSKRRINILKKIKENIANGPRNPSMIHYKNEKNHIPPWITTTNIPYGLTIEWYNILFSNDKKEICDSFISLGILNEEDTKEYVKKAFDLTKEYRNKIAHGNRTFSYGNLPALPKSQLLTLSFNAVSSEEYDKKIGQNDSFAVVLALMTMLNDQYVISNFIRELEDIFVPYHEVKFNNKSVYEVFSFPDDFIKRITDLATHKFL